MLKFDHLPTCSRHAPACMVFLFIVPLRTMKSIDKYARQYVAVEGGYVFKLHGRSRVPLDLYCWRMRIRLFLIAWSLLLFIVSLIITSICYGYF